MLPLITTQVLVERPNLTSDGALPRAYAQVGTYDGVVSTPSGTDVHIGGDQMTISATLHLDEGADLQRYDRVTDLTNSQSYEVSWLTVRYELGLGYTLAGLTRTEGVGVS